MSHVFKVYAAIDFGTNGTGLAYCIPNADGGSVYIHNKWKKFNKKRKQSGDMSNVKPKTAILLDEDGNFKSFGDNALKVYMMMQDTKLMLFEHFKMKLYNKPHYTSEKRLKMEEHKYDIDEKDNDSDITVETEEENDEKEKKDESQTTVIREKITAMNGREYPSSSVFIEALKYLKQQAMHVFKRNKLQVKSTKEVCWILTVPAIWDDVAKTQMKNWAIAADMIDPSIENHLLLRYEPDCASLSLQYEINSQLNVPSNITCNPTDDPMCEEDEKVDMNMYATEKLLKDEKYILVDAGGGTVDIACHQILDDNAVKELIHPSGGPWGDFHVDLIFVDLLCKIFGEKWIAEFKVEEPNAYLELLENFRLSKWTFWQDEEEEEEEREFHNVQVPVSFIEFMEDKIEEDDSNKYEDVEELVDQFKLELLDENLKGHFIECDGDYFKIHNSYWRKQLFDKLIDPTVDLCKKLLADDRMEGCNYLCIVGGFGSNKYFQSRLTKAFGKDSEYKLDVIIPKRPILSVIDGAARMAMKTNYVQSRILAVTYGDYVVKSLTDDQLIGCPQEWKKKNFKRKTKNGTTYKNVFVPWCKKDTEVKVDDVPRIFSFRRPSKYQQNIPFNIYVTDKDTYFWTEKEDIKCLIADKLKFPEDEKKSDIENYNAKKIVEIIKKTLENEPRLKVFRDGILQYFITENIDGKKLAKMTGTTFSNDLAEYLQNHSIRGVLAKLHRTLTINQTEEYWADFKLNFGASIVQVTGQVRGRIDTKKKLKVNSNWS